MSESRSEKHVASLNRITDQYAELKKRSRHSDLSDVLSDTEAQKFTTRAKAAISRIAGKDSPYYEQANSIYESPGNHHSHLAELIGVVEALCSDISENPSEAGDDESPNLTAPGLECPEKITFYWLFKNMPLKGWGTLAGLVVFGIYAGQTTLVREFIGKTEEHLVEDLGPAIQPVRKPVAKADSVRDTSTNVEKSPRANVQTVIGSPNAVQQNMKSSPNSIQVAGNLNMNKFHPISNGLRTQIEQNISSLSSLREEGFRVSVEAEAGNSMRRRVARDLGTLLASAQIGRFKGGISVGIAPDYPITVWCEKDQVPAVQSFIEALRPYIQGEVFIKVGPHPSKRVVRLYLNGNPLFYPDGRVVFQ